MKNTFPLLILMLLAFACKQDDSKKKQTTDVKLPKQYTIKQFMDNTQIYGGSFSHDDKNILIGNNESGIINAYAQPVTGGKPIALTNSKETVRPMSYFPEDNRILYLSDNGGNEIYNIYLREEDGSIKALTPDSTARATFFGWAHDGKSFFYQSNKRDKRAMDLYEMDIKTYKPKMIFENQGSYSIGGLSNDKQYLALGKPINSNDSDLFIYNLKNKKLTKISTDQARHSPADFSVDNKSLYYLTDGGAEFQYLMKYNIADGKKEKVLQEEWDIVYAYFSHNGKYRIVGINEDAKNVIQILDMENNKPVDFPKFDSGDITSVRISRSEKMMSFYVGSSKQTSDLYAYNFETGDYKRLSNTMNPEINPEDLVEGKVVRYRSFDGLQIPAILYKPQQASKDHKVPALVWVHGGPGGQSRLNYFGLIQYMTNHGYTILAVNNRGSSGYGKTFYKMDDQNHGEKDLQDCVEGKNFLASLPYVDAEKIGIIGGSYGGYMTMAALTRQPDAFEVGVNIFGVTNWLRTLRSIPPWWESFKDALYEEMGDPNTQDSVRLYEISPLFHAKNITKPVMVLQGAQDPRVLQVESDEIVAAVKANNIPCEYVLFEDEGHGFVKKENQIEAYGKILQFLDKYLRGAVAD